MSNHPRLLNSTAFFDSAAGVVKPGYFRLYENQNIPEFLMEDQQKRSAGAYCCRLVVATTWNQGTIGEITPSGPAYLVFDYSDDRHKADDPHFNKDVKFYFQDEKGQGWRLTMDKEVDGHFVDAIATGTSLAYLRGAYALPKQPEGQITDLIAGGTSIDPYPTDS
jgi:uncharacterized protein (DUF2235 family)